MPHYPQHTVPSTNLYFWTPETDEHDEVLPDDVVESDDPRDMFGWLQGRVNKTVKPT